MLATPPSFDFAYLFSNKIQVRQEKRVRRAKEKGNTSIKHQGLVDGIPFLCRVVQGPMFSDLGGENEKEKEKVNIITIGKEGGEEGGAGKQTLVRMFTDSFKLHLLGRERRSETTGSLTWTPAARREVSIISARSVVEA